MSDEIVNNFAQLNAFDGSPGMPLKLQKAIILYIVEKKMEGDIWISKDDIVSALKHLEEKLKGEHKILMQNYRTNAEGNNTLGSLLSEGARLYQEEPGKKIFISVDEWIIKDEDAQTCADNFLPLVTLINLTMTNRARSKVSSNIERISQQKSILDEPVILSNEVNSFINPCTISYEGEGTLTPTKICFGPLTVRKMVNDGLTHQQATEQYQKRAEIIAGYCKEIQGAGNQKWVVDNINILTPYFLDGSISEEMLRQYSKFQLYLLQSVFGPKEMMACVYDGLMTVVEAFKLSIRQVDAVHKFKEFIHDPSFTFNDVINLTHLEIEVLEKFIPQFKNEDGGKVLLIEKVLFYVRDCISSSGLSNPNVLTLPQPSWEFESLLDKNINILVPLVKKEFSTSSNHKRPCSIQ